VLTGFNLGSRPRPIAPTARAVAAAISLSVVLTGSAGLASADPRGVFVSRCTFSHSLQDDPIVHPHEPGASHLHDFFGSASTNADSTVREMIRSRTTCSLDRDTSGYWFPAGSIGSTTLTPTFSKTYYFGDARGEVEAIPRGLQMVAGVASSTSAGDNPHASWSCGAQGRHRTPIVDHPYDCTRFAQRWPFVDGIVGRIAFPSCWDGVGLAPDDVAYLIDHSCPDGFDHRLPTIGMQMHFGILDPCSGADGCSSGGSGANVTLALSSGAYYTLHADLWNTWHQRALRRLILRCLDTHIRCGVVATRASGRSSAPKRRPPVSIGVSPRPARSSGGPARGPGRDRADHPVP